MAKMSLMAQAAKTVKTAKLRGGIYVVGQKLSITVSITLSVTRVQSETDFVNLGGGELVSVRNAGSG